MFGYFLRNYFSCWSKKRLHYLNYGSQTVFVASSHTSHIKIRYNTWSFDQQDINDGMEKRGRGLIDSSAAAMHTKVCPCALCLWFLISDLTLQFSLRTQKHARGGRRSTAAAAEGHWPRRRTVSAVAMRFIHRGNAVSASRCGHAVRKVRSPTYF